MFLFKTGQLWCKNTIHFVARLIFV